MEPDQVQSLAVVQILIDADSPSDAIARLQAVGVSVVEDGVERLRVEWPISMTEYHEILNNE
jgi:hypothetical protein